MDLRPIGFVAGLFLSVLAVAMLAPALVDALAGNVDWRAFVVAAVITGLVGGALWLGCQSGGAGSMNIPQTFLLVVLVWTVLPIFGALPFAFGDHGERTIDALFEAVSGVTTTGSTVFDGLETAPPGVLLWRALLQWIGGVGIVVFAVALLPFLRSGGMQVFARPDGERERLSLYTAGRTGPRILGVYLTLTLACAIAYGLTGMEAFDAACHAMTTIATGGFANYDRSFAAFTPAAQYVAIVFMLLSAISFLRYIDLADRRLSALASDPQLRGFALGVGVAWALLIVARWGADAATAEASVRYAMFNSVSLFTGTGYANANYAVWDSFSITVLFAAGLVGGCAGSTSCSVKVFRYQILGAIVWRELRQARHPNGVFSARYGAMKISSEVALSVIAYFFVFIVSLMLLTLALAGVGLDIETAFSGAATALANVGPGFGDIIGPEGNFKALPDAAKGLLMLGMLLGRLEFLTVLVLTQPSFWRR